MLPLAHAKPVQLAALLVRVLMTVLRVLIIVKTGTLSLRHALQEVVRLVNIQMRQILKIVAVLLVPLTVMLALVLAIV